MPPRRPSHPPHAAAANRDAASARDPRSGAALPDAEAALAETPRQLRQRQSVQAVFGPPPAPVLQRLMKSRVEAQPHRFEGAARYESTNNRGEGAGRKPLLVLPTATPQVELHVHLVPLDPPKEMTGWNLKSTADGSHLLIDNTTQDIDAEDRALFDARAAGWKSPASYPNDIIWAKPPRSEREAERLALLDKQAKERRADYVSKLQAKRDAKVNSLLNATPLRLELKYTTRERRRKETHSGHLGAVMEAKPLPALPEGCSGKPLLNDDGVLTLRFDFASGRSLLANKAALIAAMDAAPEHLAWTVGSHVDNEASERLRIQGELDRYIAAVANGDHDAEVAAWSGAAADVIWR